MRFIFNFVFFGLLFFIIWKYFPDAFHTMVSWVNSLFNYLQGLVQSLIDHVNKATPSHEPEKQALFLLPLLQLKRWIK